MGSWADLLHGLLQQLVSVRELFRMAIYVNVSKLLAISESDFDNSGELGP